MFMEVFYMSKLWGNYNAAQTQAITARLAHMVINAAAGTGKTSTLAARIIYLQTEFDIPASSILAISFSRTARVRLVEKITNLCKKNRMGSPVPTYTFHGLAFRIIRLASGSKETWIKPGFNLIEFTNGQNSFALKFKDNLLKDVGKGIDKDLALTAFMKIIDELRQGSSDMEPYLTPEQLDPNFVIEIDIGQNTLVKVTSCDVITVWRRYDKLLKQFNKIDYTGLIIEATKVLLHEDSEVLRRIQNSIKVILVDEYQDTSRAQEKLLFTLAGIHIPINVVGDTDQTIYTFNGSSIANMQNFLKLAKESQVAVLSSVHMIENYRSTDAILSTANFVRKGLTSGSSLIAAKNIIDDNLRSYRNLNLPVRLIHAPRLHLAADFIAREVFKLVHEDGIHENDIAILVRKDTEYAPQGSCVKEALIKLGFDLQPTNNPTANKENNEHLYLVYEFCQDPENYGRLLADTINQTSRLDIPDGLPIETFARLLKEAYDSGARYCYEAIDLLFDNMNIDDNQESIPNGVQIRTVHSAKGEEFRVVFLLYLGDRSFPHGSRPDIDEEKRLLYVGITRAQERLYIIGRPGIHHEDFFNQCKGPMTISEDYLVIGGEQYNESQINTDHSFRVMVEQARLKQLQEEEAERKKLWEMFEDDH